MADVNNEMHSMMTSTYSDSKWSKQRELNSGMSIAPQGADALTNKLRNINGGE